MKTKFFDFQLGKETKMMPLFLSRSLRSLATSLCSLFSSIFVYKITLSSVGQQHLALLAVFAFFFGLYTFKLISVFFAEELSLRVGLKRQIYLGLALTGLCLVALFAAQRWSFFLFVAPLIWGLAAGFYWFGWHGLMVKGGRRDGFGKEIGLAGAVSGFLLAGVPLLGGLLIGLFGYSALFLTSLIFVLLSAVVTRSVHWERTHQDTSPREIFRLFMTHKRVVLAYAGEAAAATIYSVTFPLYLFLIVGSELVLGEFLTFAMVIVAVVGLLVGRWVDIRGRRAILTSGSIILAFVWLGRVLSRSLGFLFILDVVDRIADKMVGIPLVTWTYEKALEGHSTGRAIMFREIAVTGGAVFACFLLGVLVLCGAGFEIAFLVAAVFSLSPLLAPNL